MLKRLVVYTAVIIGFVRMAEAPKMYQTEAMVRMMGDRIDRVIQQERIYTVMHKYLITQGLRGKVKTRNKIVSSILSASQKYNLDPALIMVILDTESGFDFTEIGDDGELGGGQISPSDWVGILKIYGIINRPKDLLIPEKNVYACAFILRYELDRVNGDLDKALFAYNGVKKNKKAGEIYIAKVRSSMERIREFLNEK